MSDQETGAVKEEPPPTPFAEFLEGTAPGNMTSVTDLARQERDPATGAYTSGYDFVAPDIQLHCGSDSCNGTMFFRNMRLHVDLTATTWHNFYVRYRCSNCQDTMKTFSLGVCRDDGTTSGMCYKFGEFPEYGPPTAARLIKLIGPDRDMFLKGRRCENQGLGIGAFSYYRRVVENQKNRILSEIITVATNSARLRKVVQELEAAKVETQFSKALASVKDSIPQVLLINGHNPLRLLHSALSDGLHERDDAHCLETSEQYSCCPCGTVGEPVSSPQRYGRSKKSSLASSETERMKKLQPRRRSR